MSSKPLKEVSLGPVEIPALSRPVLIADIGATNARFAMVKGAGEIVNIVYLATSDFETVDDAIEQYLKDSGSIGSRPNQAVLAVPGPVSDDLIKLTNNKWLFSKTALKKQFGWDHINIINDFTAMSFALPNLNETDLELIGGKPKPIGKETLGVLGPGSGLGVGGLMHDGHGEWVDFAFSEGGHITMAATTEEEEDMLHYLRKEFTHASAEECLSGPGLVNLYTYFATRNGGTAENLEPEEISVRALGNQCPHCRAATKMFSELLGTMASTVALMLGATGGIYIAGGIVKRMEKAFDKNAFRKRFERNVKMKDFLIDIPTYMITSRHSAFLGLRHVALQGV